MLMIFDRRTVVYRIRPTDLFGVGDGEPLLGAPNGSARGWGRGSELLA